MKPIKSEEQVLAEQEWEGHKLHFLCRHFWQEECVGYFTKGTLKTGKNVRKMQYNICIGCGRRQLLISEWKESLPSSEVRGHGDTGYT